jgi:hypothetical protein
MLSHPLVPVRLALTRAPPCAFLGFSSAYLKAYGLNIGFSIIFEKNLS